MNVEPSKNTAFSKVVRRGKAAQDGKRRSVGQLTHRQQDAIAHYLAHGNASAAYASAYSTDTLSRTELGQVSSRFFRQPHILAAINEARAAAAKPLHMQRDEALSILAQIARGQVADYLDDDGRVDPRALKALGGPAVESLEQESTKGRQRAVLKLRDPIRAIERIARLMGWDEPERHAVGQVTVTLDVAAPLDEGTRRARASQPEDCRPPALPDGTALIPADDPGQIADAAAHAAARALSQAQAERRMALMDAADAPDADAPDADADDIDSAAASTATAAGHGHGHEPDLAPGEDHIQPLPYPSATADAAAFDPDATATAYAGDIDAGQPLAFDPDSLDPFAGGTASAEQPISDLDAGRWP